MKLKARPKCLCCKKLFIPDPRSDYHQEFCAKAACRKASKFLSQQRWRDKARNQSYWRGPKEVQRVRDWRKAHPRYWKRGVRADNSTLQDDCIPQNPLLVGLISMLMGSTLQDHIAATCCDLVAKGREILRKRKTATGPKP
ncbi:MAG: hypothetical protein L0Z50_38215 [Verrucomicrobiales bacterium]|nr:hypothetical protein [Verrucomicrobiales bacterium]